MRFVAMVEVLASHEVREMRLDGDGRDGCV